MNPAESLPLLPGQAWNLTKVAQAGPFVNNFNQELGKRASGRSGQNGWL
jgi:hypothetical protein